MLQILCQMLPQFPLPLSGHCGKEENLFWVSHLEGRRCDLATPTSAPPAHLIYLCQHGHMGDARGTKPCAHLLIEGGGWMAGIHNHHHSPEHLSISQISFHHACPGPPHSLGDLGIPIPGKVYKIESPSVDPEKIYRLSPPGSLGDPGELPPAQEPIEQGGFPHIRATGKGDLWPPVPGKVPWTCRAAYEFGRGYFHILQVVNFIENTRGKDPGQGEMESCP